MTVPRLAGALIKRAWIPLVLAALPIGAALHAQAPAAGSLAEERAVFLRKVLTESQLLTEQYERALAKLESEIAATGDYEEARLVQQRRDELKALYPDSGDFLAQAQAIPLLPTQARLSGATEARGDVLTGWRTAGSAAEWTNLRLSPGRYYVEMETNMVELPLHPGSLTPGRAQPQERAVFQFHEVSLLAGAEENRRSFEIRLNPDDTTFTRVQVGPVTFTRSPVTLRMSAEAGYPGNLLRLRNPRLVPLKDEAVPSAPAAPKATSLEQIRKSFLAALAQVQKPVATSYLTRLKKLAAATPGLREEVEAETARVQKTLAGPPEGAAAQLRLFSTPGAGGFEDLDGAHLVPEEGRRGDQITVEHEGKKLPIRLMWVMCAPLDDSDKNARKDVAKHFGIEEEDTTGLARMAGEFTQGYLEGKPLRLLVRPGTDKDGSRRALVFLPSVGLFQNMLIDQGLAAVSVPPPSPRRAAIEKALLGSLLEHEAIAKRRKSGAWGLSQEDKK